MSMMGMRKAAANLDRMVKGGNDEVFKHFIDPTDKLQKIVKKQLGVDSLVWFETWIYLLCRTKVQCILHNVPFDIDRATSILAGVDGNTLFIQPRWSAYSELKIDPSVPAEKAPRETATEWARLFIHYQLEGLAKLTGADLSNVKIPSDKYLIIAAKTEEMAAKICKELAKK